MMTSKKQLQIATWIAAILFIAGILSYIFSATAAKSRDEEEKTAPLRVLYKTAGGNVLFDHKTHTNETKYGLACTDCHHHPSDEEEAIRSCSDCHLYPDAETTVHPTCLDCHEQDEVEGVETNNQVQSAHSRGECIKCHTEFGNGPIECEKCHYN